MADQLPPGCTCARINVDMTGDVPGTQWIRGRSDPPCRVHLRQERALWDAGYRQACQDAQTVVNAEVSNPQDADRANHGIFRLGNP